MKSQDIKFRCFDIIRKQMAYQVETQVIAQDGTEYSMIEFHFSGASDWSNPVVTLATVLKYPARYCVMQFTGMFADNGEDIYTGDILQYTRKNWRSNWDGKIYTVVDLALVIWDNDSHSYRQRSYRGGVLVSSGPLSFDDHRSEENLLVRIGNINENPEILD